MEMHQVRYFLATVGELNFTKAAEKCNVSQPSLTRAIKQLEGELGGLFAGLEMKLLRGTAEDVVELLKKGDAELAIAGTIEETWERLDKWPLFTERFQLLMNRQHPLAQRSQISINELREQKFLQRNYCENAAQTS